MKLRESFHNIRRGRLLNFLYTMPNECLNSVLRFREMSLTALTSALLLRRAHIKSDSSQHKLFDKTVSAVIYHHGLASHRRCRGELTNHLPHQSQSSYTYKRNQRTSETLLRHGEGSFFYNFEASVKCICWQKYNTHY